MKSKKIAGMGSMPYEKGTAFRVWAPHAEKVFVAGSFNDWNEDEHALSSEENGYWYGNVKEASPGDEYKYVIWNGEKKLLKNDPYAKELTNSAGNSKIVSPDFDWEEDAFVIPSWNELIIYEMHIGSFNTINGEESGNFHSAIQKIPYLKDLGINAIELMPIMEFQGDNSMGYNPAYLFSTESSYGRAADLKLLIREAHKAGIAVILDVVYNHIGPDDMDLWQFDGWSENGKGGIYFYNDWRSKTPWGNTRPDYGRDEVKQYLRDNALMWMKEYRVDGLRFDSTAYLRNTKGLNNSPGDDIAEGWSFMQWVNNEITKRCPEKLSIAEDLHLNSWLTRPEEEGGAGFGSQWDLGFARNIRKLLTLPKDEERDLETIAGEIGKNVDGDVFSRVIYTEIHDTIAGQKVRLPQSINPENPDDWFAKKRAILGTAILLTSAGIPMIFQGQEFLENSLFNDQQKLNWELSEAHSGLLDLHKTLINLRRNLSGTTRGLTGQHTEVFHLNNTDKVLAYHRWHEGGSKDSVIMVVNFKNETLDNYIIGVPAPGAWKVRFNSDWKGYDATFTDSYTGDPQAQDLARDGMPHQISLKIGPYSVLILSQEK